MAKVAVIITDLFEDSEYTEPVKALRGAGHEVIHVGFKKGEIVKGKKTATPVVIDQSLDTASAGQFDALLIPGGYSPDKLRADPKAVQFAGKFMEADKPVFAICHGAQLLISAKAVEGRKITGWKSISQDLIYAGADFHDQEVVVDRNLVSSRSPADLPAFVEACLQKL